MGLKIGPVALGDTESKVVLIVVGGVALYLIYKASRFGSAVAEYVADPNNVANRTVEGVYSAVTGSEGTPGGDLFDATHDENGPTFWGTIFDAITGQTSTQRAADELNARVTEELARAEAARVSTVPALGQ